MKLNLKVGQEFSDDEVEKMVGSAELQKVYEKILRFASLRPRSVKEYKDWFRRHKVHESMHRGLFNKLKRFDFVDDERFALWWVRQRKEFKLKSMRELWSELRLKGIDKNIIDEVISNVGIDDTESVKKLLKKKLYRWEKLPPKKAKIKISAYLSRKGFRWEAIRSALKEIEIIDD